MAIALRIWNLLGGIDWQGLEVAVEMYGVRDVEQVIRQMVAVRDFQARKREA